MSDIPAPEVSAVNWQKRLLYVFISLVWLFVVSLPFLAFMLAANGEVRLGSEAESHIRFFLLQEIDTQGIGIEWVSPFRDENGCTNSHVRYLLWEGSGINADYCSCVDHETGEIQYADSTCQDRPLETIGE